MNKKLKNALIGALVAFLAAMFAGYVSPSQIASGLCQFAGLCSEDPK